MSSIVEVVLHVMCCGIPICGKVGSVGRTWRSRAKADSAEHQPTRGNPGSGVREPVAASPSQEMNASVCVVAWEWWLWVLSWYPPVEWNSESERVNYGSGMEVLKGGPPDSLRSKFKLPPRLSSVFDTCLFVRVVFNIFAEQRI
eukprot:781398-Amphidinium_carterae.1